MLSSRTLSFMDRSGGVEDELETIECVVPSEAIPGTSINVQTPDGRIYSVVVPEGYKAGDKLRVSVSHSSGEAQVVSAKKEYSTATKTIGAAATGAVIGTLLVGPVVGIVVAGAAVYATTRDDQVGDVARNVGSYAASAFDKGAELAKQYQIPEKLNAAASATKSKLMEINEEYKVTEKVSQGASVAATKAKEMDERYGISSKAGSLLSQGASMAASSISRSMMGSSQGTERK